MLQIPVIYGSFFLVTFLPLLFCGCALPIGSQKSQTRDYAYIEYWPPAENADQLRLAVKDVIDIRNSVTTAGSLYVAENAKPAARDASCLNAARSGDVAIVGKTTLSEFALGTSGINEHYGAPINPVAPSRIPGGSSSGSAVAVANNSADVALGSDTAGSIRVPAACCGVLGLKTTFGLVSLKGVFPLSPANLDTIGPMAADIPRLVEGMELLDPGFEARYKQAVAAQPSATSIRVGRLYLDGTNYRIEHAIDKALKRTGFDIVRLNDKFKEEWETAKKNGNTIALVDGWLHDRKYAGKSGVGLTTTATIGLGETLYPDEYRKAIEGRKAWQQALRRIFERVDFIALPTLKDFPPRKPFLFRRTAFIEQRMLKMQNTVPANYAGNPAIAVPIYLKGRGFPVTSLQLVGPLFSEPELVSAATLFMNRKGS